MANPKINTTLSFSTEGKGNVNNDVRSIKSGVDGASSAVEKLNSRFKALQAGVALQSVVTAASAVKGAFSAVTDVVGGAVSAVYGMAQAQAASADKLGKTAALFGMQASALQALRSAGQHAGMSIESIDSALEKFSINTGKAAAGTKQQLELFNALGVAVRNSDGTMRSQTDLLLSAADAYSKLTSTQDKNRVSQELFGRSAVQMSALLSDGSAGLRAAIEQYQKTGAGYTDQQTKQAAEFNDTFQTMGEYVSGVQKKLEFALVPSFAKLFKNVASFIDSNQSEIDSIVNKLSKNLPKVIDDVTSALPVILSGVSAVAGAVSDVVEFTGPWVPILSAAGALVGGAILTAVGAVGAAVLTIGPAFGTAVAAAAPIVGIVGAATVGIVAWGSAIKSVYDNWAMLKSFVVDDVYPAFISGIKQFANSAIEVFATIADGMAKIPVIGSIADGAGDWWRSQKFDVGSMPTFDSVPSGQESSSKMTGAPAGISSSLTVDFKGVPRGTKITPADNFGSSDFDYSAGYAFGG